MPIRNRAEAKAAAAQILAELKHRLENDIDQIREDAQLGYMVRIAWKRSLGSKVEVWRAAAEFLADPDDPRITDEPTDPD
ncbi:MAG: hypothetical protein AAFZ07_28390 [Actinomycetota bacterium]